MLNFVLKITLPLLLIFGGILLAQGQSASQGLAKITEVTGYPVPEGYPDKLFYLQRSLDLNSVIYEADYVTDESGKRRLNSERPVNIFWLLNDANGSTKPLSKIQRLGYGIRLDEESRAGSLKIALVAYRDMPIILKPSGLGGRYHAHVSLDNRDVILSRVFINIDGGTKLTPNVTFIEIVGTESATGKKIVHRFKP